MNVEIDTLAIEVVRYFRECDPDPGTMAALLIAIDTARATVADFKDAAAVHYS